MLHRNKVISFQLYFIILVIMIVIFILKKLVDEKNDKLNLEIILETNEEYNSISYGCKKFFDSYRFLSSSLDKIVKNLDSGRF